MKKLNMLSIDEAVSVIQDGGVGVLRTDTLYGLVCSAAQPEAVRRLYALKQRDQKPGTVIAASIEQLVALGVPRRYVKAVEHFWPNPISVVIPLGWQLPELHAGKGSVAFRIPSDLAIKAVVEKTGPLLTSSANHPGEAPAETIEQAQAYFGDNVDFYVDGGTVEHSVPSTVIRVVDDAVEVLRQGAVQINEKGEIIQ